MNFTCDRQALLQAVSTAARAASPKSPIPALEGLLIEATERGKVRITGYDLKTGIVSETEAHVPESGDIVVNARLFGDIIRRLPGDQVAVSVGTASATARIECGDTAYDIVRTQATDYPALPIPDGRTALFIDGPTLRDMLSQTIFAVSDNESRPALTGALLEAENDTLTVVAVDGFRLALRREKLEKETEDTVFIVPGAALHEVERIISAAEAEEVSILVGDKHITFKTGDALLISRRLEGEVIDYRRAVPKDGRYSLGVSRRELEQAVDRVSLIISDKVKSPVRCVFSNNHVSLLTISAYGRASDECELSGECEKMEIGFNNRYLLDALRAAPAENLVLCVTSPIQPCVILPQDPEDDSFQYMVLPVRLGGADVRSEG
ncbi:MAG: DNA polymerase III subunit beta [Clostridiales bacterium]|nr:DNA polymerase III subunit beta [Clostridiales bacterium]